MLHFSSVFLYILSWNDSIKRDTSLFCCDSCNYFHRITGYNSYACNPWPCHRQPRYVQPLNIILKLKMSYYHRKSWKFDSWLETFVSLVISKTQYSHFRTHSISIVEKYKQAIRNTNERRYPFHVTVKVNVVTCEYIDFYLTA